MNNSTKLLLSPMIMIIGTMTALSTEGVQTAQIVLDVNKSINIDGTVNIVPDTGIRVAEEQWITNNGVFNFHRNNAEEKFDIIGTNSSKPSGIINHCETYNHVDAVYSVLRYDDVESQASSEIKSTATDYYYVQPGAGEMWCITSSGDEETKTRLSPECFNTFDGGTINLGNQMSLYAFLKEAPNVTNNGNGTNNVIVLKGKIPNKDDDFSDTDFIVKLDDSYPGLEKTTQEQPMVINASFVNSSFFRTFHDARLQQGYPDIDLSRGYPIKIKGFYNFMGNNLECVGDNIEFIEGESTISSVKSMFNHNNIDVSSKCVLKLELNNSSNPCTFSKTINIKPDDSLALVEVKRFGRLVIGESSKIAFGKDSVINLGFVQRPIDTSGTEVIIDNNPR